MPVANSVTVTLGSRIVTGYLTQFVGMTDDTFSLNGLNFPIASVDSTTQLTLAYGYPGATAADQVNWDIIQSSEYWANPIVIADQVTTLLRKISEGLPLKADATGTLAQRAAYDNQPQGFLFLRTDINPFLMYAKTAATAGAWSAGSSLKGDPGPNYDLRITTLEGQVQNILNRLTAGGL
jgi:hypothetical protein